MSYIQVIQYVFWAVFYLSCPAALLYLCKRHRFFNKIGEVILAYSIGLILGNTIIHQDYMPLLEGISFVTILVAIPLMLFSVNIRSIKSLAGKTLLSFSLGLFALLVVVSCGFFIFKNQIADAPIISGMLVGVYTGGTLNVAAIGKALNANNTLFITVTTIDIVVSMLYFIVLLSFGKNVLARFLPPYSGDKTSAIKEELAHKMTLNRMSVTRLLIIIGIALVINLLAAAVIGFKFSLPWQMATFILMVTTFAIIAGAFKYVNQTKGAFDLGYYLILSFCMVIGSMANVEKLLSVNPLTFGYVAIIVFGTLLLHVLLSKVFKVDRDTTIITSIAMIFSPPFVPVVATTLKNHNLIIPGMTVGVIGYLIGNYFGIAMAYLLSLF